MEQISVLFVCLGNICRSPLAEGVFRKLVKERGLEQRFLIESCGTGSWHTGKPPHEGTLDIAAQYEIPLDGKRARSLSADDYSRFDLLIAMDCENRADIKARGEVSGQLYCLREFGEEGEDLDVPDPYYTGDFETVYRIIDRCCRALLDDVISGKLT